VALGASLAAYLAAAALTGHVRIEASDVERGF
jgi:hypothetical protein